MKWEIRDISLNANFYFPKRTTLFFIFYDNPLYSNRAKKDKIEPTQIPGEIYSNMMPYLCFNLDITPEIYTKNQIKSKPAQRQQTNEAKQRKNMRKFLSAMNLFHNYYNEKQLINTYPERIYSFKNIYDLLDNLTLDQIIEYTSLITKELENFSINNSDVISIIKNKMNLNDEDFIELTHYIKNLKKKDLFLASDCGISFYYTILLDKLKDNRQNIIKFANNLYKIIKKSNLPKEKLRNFLHTMCMTHESQHDEVLDFLSKLNNNSDIYKYERIHKETDHDVNRTNIIFKLYEKGHTLVIEYKNGIDKPKSKINIIAKILNLLPNDKISLKLIYELLSDEDITKFIDQEFYNTLKNIQDSKQRLEYFKDECKKIIDDNDNDDDNDDDDDEDDNEDDDNINPFPTLLKQSYNSGLSLPASTVPTLPQMDLQSTTPYQLPQWSAGLMSPSISFSPATATPLPSIHSYNDIANPLSIMTQQPQSAYLPSQTAASSNESLLAFLLSQPAKQSYNSGLSLPTSTVPTLPQIGLQSATPYQLPQWLTGLMSASISFSPATATPLPSIHSYNDIANPLSIMTQQPKSAYAPSQTATSSSDSNESLLALLLSQSVEQSYNSALSLPTSTVPTMPQMGLQATTSSELPHRLTGFKRPRDESLYEASTASDSNDQVNENNNLHSIKRKKNG